MIRVRWVSTLWGSGWQKASRGSTQEVFPRGLRNFLEAKATPWFLDCFAKVRLGRQLPAGVLTRRRSEVWYE